MGTASKHGENETFLSLCRRGGGIFLSFFYSSEPGMTQKLTRSRVFFCSLHEPHAASFSRDVILVPILRLFLFGLFVFFFRFYCWKHPDLYSRWLHFNTLVEPQRMRKNR